MAEPVAGGSTREHRSRVELLHRDFDRDGIGPLRHEIGRVAEDNGLTGLDQYRFVVAVNEITTNAVRHGGGRGHIDIWRVEDRLHCQVSDRGPGFAPDAGDGRARAPDDSSNGRGLWLARRGCDLTIRSDTSGSTVTLSCATRP